jgi:MATE family multidrug resistance protein
MSLGVVDTIMVGHVSATALAAVALGNLYTFGLLIFGLGVLLALDPIVAQALGAEDEVAVQRGLQRGLLLSFILTIPTSLLILAVDPVLTLAQQPAEVIPYAAGYVYRVAPSVWPFFAFIALRQTLQAHHRTRPIVITILIANLANVFLNYAWIFGKFGFPELGVLGSAWATTVGRWLMAALVLALGWKHLSPYLRGLAPRVFQLEPLGRMLRLGAPIGVQMLFEWGAFAAIGLLMGSLGVIQMAAHQVALNLASLTFMVPLGVSSAAAVIVGHAVGREDAAGVRRSSLAALIVGAGFMSITAIVFVTIPALLAGIYTTNVDIIRLAVLLLPIAGVFQVFDGTQVVCLGILRGLGDMRGPMIISTLGFWCLGMPVSVWLAFGRDLGAPGLWWGLVAGLAVVAIVLALRVRHREHYSLERIIIDEYDKSHPVDQKERTFG